MRKMTWAAWGTACLMLAGCTAADMAAFSEGLAEASYDMPYNSYAAPYGSTVIGTPYTPYTFQTYGGWPAGTSYGTWVGYGECQNIGSFYQCDTNGDGYVDMYGDTDDGSYASSNLRVNGRGEAYTWDSDCACWARDRAYDGPRTDDSHHHHDHYDH